MAIHDYRLNPFLGTFEVKAILNEQHTIPTNSPYTIRLNEVPQKTEPTTLQVKFSDGTALVEVAAQPAQGQYWPDYNTTEHGIADWNTGTLLFNAADAGKVVQVSYNGLGTLTDDRLMDMVDASLTSSTQPERDGIITSVASYDTTVDNRPNRWDWQSTRGRIKTHKGLGAGTYTLRKVLQQLVNMSHTHEYVREYYNCNCNCDCNDCD